MPTPTHAPSRAGVLISGRAGCRIRTELLCCVVAALSILVLVPFQPNSVLHSACCHGLPLISLPYPQVCLLVVTCYVFLILLCFCFPFIPFSPLLPSIAFHSRVPSFPQLCLAPSLQNSRLTPVPKTLPEKCSNLHNLGRKNMSGKMGDRIDPPNDTKVRKTRASKPKVKTGCQTCK